MASTTINPPTADPSTKKRGALTDPMPSNMPLTPPSEPAQLSNDDTISSVGSPTSSKKVAQPAHKHIWVITGPAGCGKTSVAEYLHEMSGLPYLEGDVYHPPANVEKMGNNIPLTDADRWDWLILLREEALSKLSTTSSTPTSTGVIVTCSALKRKYRDVMRLASYNNPSVRVHFIFLQATEALLLDRVRMRKGHYMKDSMVRSQFQSLEAPQGDEGDVLAVDASGDSEAVRRLAVGVMEKVLVEDV